MPTVPGILFISVCFGSFTPFTYAQVHEADSMCVVVDVIAALRAMQDNQASLPR
jgi:hypothetical protein